MGRTPTVADSVAVVDSLLDLCGVWPNRSFLLQPKSRSNSPKAVRLAPAA
jgi:hypothetical protein